MAQHYTPPLNMCYESHRVRADSPGAASVGGLSTPYVQKSNCRRQLDNGQKPFEIHCDTLAAPLQAAAFPTPPIACLLT